MRPLAIQLPAPRRITLGLVCVVLTLVCLSTLGQFARHVLGHDMLKGFVPTFFVDNESSVPTWYSSAALALAAALLAVIALTKFQARGKQGDDGTTAADKFRWHWAALAALFALLSLDEIAMFHELPIQPLRETYGTGGIWYYPWVGLGMLFVTLVGLAFARFLLHLPRRTRYLICAAGTAFVGGAIGVEMVSGWFADRLSEQSPLYAVTVTIEELCEMLGVVIFIHALVDYLQRHSPAIHVSFQREGTAA